MSLVLLGSTSGSVTLQEPAVAGTTTLTLPAVSGTILQSGTTVTEAQGGTGTTTGYYGFKNRIINPAMVIDQRNAGASVTQNTSIQYSVDRWYCYGAVTSKFTIQQNAGSVTPPTGFINYLGCTSSSAYSVGSSDEFNVSQRIEGLNVADLGFGTANASTVTVSFWVRSSLTGTFGGSLYNSGNSRSYPFTYTISLANTWEQKSITVAGDTSGTWLTTNGLGLGVNFSLGAGTTRSGTAGAWASANYASATGATSVVGTNGATFYITGVQLEKGSTATSFDYRPYGTELALCQRYYQRSSSISGNYNYLSNWGSNASTTVLRCTFPLKTSLRTSPSSVDFANLCIDDNLSAPSVTAVAIYNTSAADAVGLQATVASGLTQYRPAIIANVGGIGYIGVSAEL
jgi:hypothetical protein